MKRMFLFAMVIVMCVNVFVGCNQKIPEGIENKEFYKDMVSVFRDIAKSVETKNVVKYQKNIENILVKYFKEVETDKYTSREKKIYESINNLNLEYEIYMNWYFRSNNEFNLSKIIDDEQGNGYDFIKAVEQTINVLGLDYEFTNN